MPKLSEHFFFHLTHPRRQKYTLNHKLYHFKLKHDNLKKGIQKKNNLNPNLVVSKFNSLKVVFLGL